MTAPTWTARCARMLEAQLDALAADAQHTLRCEALTVELDHGLGTAAVAAITATPAGPRRDVELATWARRIASGPGCIAIVVDDAFGDEEIAVVAQLHRRVRLELRGER